MTQINVAILDDHQIIIDGLKLLLESEIGINVVMENNDGEAFLAELKTNNTPVHILIMDLMMPNLNGYEMAQILQKQYPNIKIIILSMNTQATLAYKLVEESDIKAFLPKSVNKSILMEAIYKVHNDETYIHPSIIEELKTFKVKINEKEKLMISPRELEIISLLCNGMNNKDIAAHLFLSEHTIATHRKNISKKTNTHNVASLIELTRRLSLLELQ